MQNTHWKITQPCHEPIEKMDVTQRGHYCHSCQKEVINLDGVSPRDVNYQPGDQVCGRMTVTNPAQVRIVALGRWSSFLLKWTGVWALFLLPVKKAKTQEQEQGLKNNVPEKQNLGKSKRFIGTVRGADNKPVQTKVVMSDSTGKIIAETKSISNGRYMMVVDTPGVIKSPELTITALDTPYVVKLDTHLVWTYPKDSIWIHPEITYNTGPSISIITNTLGWTTPISIPGGMVFEIVQPEDAGEALEWGAQGGVEGFKT